MERILDFKIIFVLGFVKYDPWYFSCPTFNDTSCTSVKYRVLRIVDLFYV